MSQSEKLTKKYAAVEFIIPPAPEEELEELPSFKTPTVPVIKDISEEEMQEWDKYVAQQNALKLLKKMPGMGADEAGTLSEEEGTIPVVKRKAKFSNEQLVKLCGRYYNLCVKF